MEVTDLMIGDWVRIKGHLDYDKVREIAMDEKLQWYISYACSVTTLFRAYEFEPIPLTPEILEKNGFNFGLTPLEEALSELDDFDDDFREEYDDTEARPDAFFKEHWSYTDEGVELHLYSSDDLKKGNLFVDEHKLKGHLEFTFQDCLYVHQFQHALRLCRLNELANNFEL